MVRKKHATFIFFEKLRNTLVDFNSFWHTTLGKNLSQTTVVFGHLTLIL